MAQIFRQISVICYNNMKFLTQKIKNTKNLYKNFEMRKIFAHPKRRFQTLILLVGLFFSSHHLHAQVNWVELDEAVKIAQTQRKKILIKVYTNWCGWCKEMDKNTFSNDYVSKYLNEHYVCVRFNAEQKNDITFQGKVYRLVRTSRGSYHELAAKWLNGNMSYPSTVFLDENGFYIQTIAGYLRPQELEKIITYFATNSHFSMPWQSFESGYKRVEK